MCMTSLVSPMQTHCCRTAGGRAFLLGSLSDSSFLSLLRKRRDLLPLWIGDIRCVLGMCENPRKEKLDEGKCLCNECVDGNDVEEDNALSLLRIEQYHLRERIIQRIRLVQQEKEWKHDQTLMSIKNIFPELR